MKPKAYLPADDSELTRQVEMLMQGYAVDEMSGVLRPEPVEQRRRTLDDMRRLSEHIKNVPVYRR